MPRTPFAYRTFLYEINLMKPRTVNEFLRELSKMLKDLGIDPNDF